METGYLRGSDYRYTDSAGFTEYGPSHYRSVQVFIMDLNGVYVSVLSFDVPVCPHSLGKQPTNREKDKHFKFPVYSYLM